MSRHPASLDLVRRIILQPSIVRAFWSVTRAWPGKIVKLHAETRNVPDGTPIVFEVRPVDPAVDLVLETIDQGLVIENSRCITDHEIAWDDDALAQFLAASTLYRFRFDAVIQKYGLRLSSGELYVPFEPFEPSH